jgi:hypothetical protein
VRDILDSPDGRRLIAADISARQRAIGPEVMTIQAVGPDATVIRFTQGLCTQPSFSVCPPVAVAAVAQTLIENLGATFGFRRVECARCRTSISLEEKERQHDQHG